MKAIPFKRCEAANGGHTLANALRQFVHFNYKSNPNFNDADFKAIDSGLGEIALLRDKAISVSNHIDRSINPESMVEILQAYYGVLTEFEKRFPFGAYKSSFFSKQTPAVMVEWKWADAYRSVKISSSYSVKLERAAVLFNVGAAFTICACTSDRSTEDGIKRAVQYFLKAAGVYQHMCDNIAEFAQGQTQDLNAASFRFLKELVYAQALACTFESAVSKKMLPGTIAMLASGVANQYQAALSLIQPQLPLGDWFSKTNVKWENHLSYQTLCFRAASQYWNSKIDLNEYRYGVEISRLNYALEFLRQSEKFEPNAPSVQESRKKLVATIQARLKDAEKDNEKIYNEVPPKFNDLPKIEPKAIGKPIDYVTPPPSYPKIFEKLIPLEIQHSADHLKEILNKNFDSVTRLSSEATDMARVSLSSVNLPASLEAVEMKEKLPENMKQSLRDIQNSGGYICLTVLRREVQDCNGGCLSLFNEISQDLEKELKVEKDMRSKYGMKWTRNSSEEVGAEYHRELNNARKFFRQAESADTSIDRLLNSNTQTFNILSCSIQDLESRIPSSDTVLKSPESDSVRKHLDALSKIIHSREQLIKTFENNLKSLDIASKIMERGQTSDHDKIFAEISHPFNEMKSNIEANMNQQKLALEEIIKANELFMAKKSANAALQKKQELLQELNQAINLFEKLKKELIQGKLFYLDLLANCLEPLKVNVSGFCAARQTEAAILSEEFDGSSSTPNRDFTPSAPDYSDFGDYPSFHK